MKLLQTILEAVESKASLAAQAIMSDADKLNELARGAVSQLKKNFGDQLMDTPMAVITQHVRSFVDAASNVRLNKDGLEQVTSAVVSKLSSHLGESVQEGKMSELALDLKELSASDFKKKYEHTKAEMRKQLTEEEEAQDDLTEGDCSVDELKDKLAKLRKDLASFKGNNPGDDRNRTLIRSDIRDVQQEIKAAKKTVKEGIIGQETSIQEVMDYILSEELSAEDVMIRPQGAAQRAAAKVIQRLYDDIAGESGLHGDDDFEQIMLTVYEELEAKYSGNPVSPFESVKDDGDDEWYDAQGNVDPNGAYDAGGHFYAERGLSEATRGRPRKNPPKEEKVPGKRGRPSKASKEAPAASKPAAKDEDDDNKKVSSKALAKSMENDDGEEDADTAKAASAEKDAPKKVVDTKAKPEELNDANKKLSKQIQHAVDISGAKSAFELSKELRATFKDITAEQVKQATTIWRAENE